MLTKKPEDSGYLFENHQAESPGHPSVPICQWQAD